MPIAAEETAWGMDLLRVRAMRALIRWKGFPYSLQAGALLALGALAAIGWGWLTPAGVAAKLYAKSHLVTLMVWGLWWPAMIWATVLLGRVWCTVCPLELTGGLAERLGVRLGIAQRPLPRWMAGGALAVVLYGLLQFLVAGAQLHRVPAYTSVMLLAMLALSIMAGLFFRDRAYCRGFCPVAELLATYGRGGILAVRPGPREACEACVDKECAAAQYRYRFDARSCPTLLNPARLAGSRDCLLCTQCIKSCRSANMRLLLRTPFPAGDLRSALASWPTTIFVMLISGFVTWELTTEWKTAEALFLAAPRWVSRQLGLTAAAGYVNGVWALAAVPLAVWTLLSFAARLTRRASGLVDAWRRLALPLAVIVAAGQMAKALSKFTSWVGFLPLAASRPDGLETARAITAKELATPAPWLPLAWVSAAGMVLVTAALLFAIREARLAGSRAWLPQALLAAGFLFIIAGWA